MLISGIAFDFAGVALKKREFRTVGFWMLVIAVLGAAVALITGTQTAWMLFHGLIPSTVYDHRFAGYVTGATALILLLWRIKAGDAHAGPALYATLILGALAAISAGYTGYLGGRMALGGADVSSAASAVSIRPLKPARPSSGSSKPTSISPMPSASLIAAGKQAFYSDDQGCTDCHSIDGSGGHMGPDLTHEGSRHPDVNWQVAHLTDPQEINPNSPMPPYDTTSPQTLQDLAHFLVSLK